MGMPKIPTILPQNIQSTTSDTLHALLYYQQLAPHYQHQNKVMAAPDRIKTPHPVAWRVIWMPNQQPPRR